MRIPLIYKLINWYYSTDVSVLKVRVDSDAVGWVDLKEYVGAKSAVVGEGIEIVKLNLTISLVLPKFCSAQLSN